MVVIWVAFSGSRNSEDLNANINQTIEGKIQPTLAPSEITVGLYDPAESPSEPTKLLDSRLKDIGFKTVILQELVDPDSANQEKTTLLFLPATREALKVLEQEIIKSNLYREGQNEAILQDVVISAWNIEDINWGNLQAAADKLNNPEPKEVTAVVLNAGAKEGVAGELAELLQNEGYAQAEAKNAEDEMVAEKPILIYHQRNYKETAKNLRELLSDNDYDGVSYQIRLEQEANIVIILGPELSETATSNESKTEAE